MAWSAHSDCVGSWMYACLGVTCHLPFLQNDRGLLHAIAITRGWSRHRKIVSTESQPWRRKFLRHSCRDSNWQPLDHESGTLTNKLSRPGKTTRNKCPILTCPFLRFRCDCCERSHLTNSTPCNMAINLL